jgi:hypothetical protein
MPRHMIIWTEGSQTDSIEVYHDEPTVVVIADRKDLPALRTLDEANIPGIYILIGKNNMRYVGQASGAMYSRLYSHNKDKPWWEQVVLFSREDGRLDKSQLDWLESKLIADMTDSGFTMDNLAAGNMSHIESYQKGRAAQLFSSAIRMLRDHAKLDVLKTDRVRNPKALKSSPAASVEVSGTVTVVDSTGVPTVKPQAPAVVYPVQKKMFTILDSNGVTHSATHRRGTYTGYLQKVLSDETLRFKVETMFQEGTMEKGLFNQFSSIAEERREFYTLLYEDIAVYHNLNAKNLSRSVEKIAKLLNLEIEHDFTS